MPRSRSSSRAFKSLAVLGGVLTGVLVLTVALGAVQQQDPLSEPFLGVTTDGTVVPGLFSIEATGVTTAPMKAAAERFLAGLSPEQRDAASFPADDVEWRMWHNVHRAERQGVSFAEMTEAQRDLAVGLMSASLSAEGVEESIGIMNLNGHLAELLPERAEEYGEHKYWVTVMGEPSMTEPWGWQLDGHHLVINYFVLGDQVVMTPTFMGSEPVVAESGRWAGTTVLQGEQDRGLAFMQSLTPEQQGVARADMEKGRGHNQAQAFRDNLVLAYEGLRADALTGEQRHGLLHLIEEYVGVMDEGHAAVRMAEVEAHLDETWFYWIGEVGPDAVFYYRIHSPVILIEFDHQGPVALGGDRQVAQRNHIHTVVRTPNGNDYGKDLLRQHYEAHAGDPDHGHAHAMPGGR
jgi:hypothetical protein